MNLYHGKEGSVKDERISFESGKFIHWQSISFCSPVKGDCTAVQLCNRAIFFYSNETVLQLPSVISFSLIDIEHSTIIFHNVIYQLKWSPEMKS